MPDSVTNLLQVVRFDFMLDAARKVWLIEINQSPRIHVARAGDTAWRAALADDMAASRAESRAGQSCLPDECKALAIMLFCGAVNILRSELNLLINSVY